MDPHEKNGRAGWFQGKPDLCPGPPASHGSPVRLVLLGAPGVGKGTQAALLSQRIGACHLSTGDVFRAAGSRPVCEQTPALQAAIEYMRRGELVPDSTVWGMVQERGGCLRCFGGFILDGFPRTLGQAIALKRFLGEENLPLDAVVNYELPIGEIVARLSGRRTCRDCKAVFHVSGQPPRREGLCDHCGGPLYQREDDRAEAILVRLENYRRATAPLIDFYTELGLLLSVPAVGTPNTICAQTLAMLERVLPTARR